MNTMRGETQPRRGVPNSGNTDDDAVEYARDIGENISDRIASGGWVVPSIAPHTTFEDTSSGRVPRSGRENGSSDARVV